MADDGKRLTPLETIVMDDLWEHATSTVREVMARLEERKPMAYTTVLTVMRKLRDKGFLLSDREGRTDRYRPTVSRDQMASRGRIGSADQLCRWTDARRRIHHPEWKDPSHECPRRPQKLNSPSAFIASLKDPRVSRALPVSSLVLPLS